MTDPTPLFDPARPDCCAGCGRPLGTLNARPRAHRDGTSTERAAANVAWRKAGDSRHRILTRLHEVFPDGRTFAELERELSMFSARQRLHDLKDGGWVEPTGEQRLTPRGVPADVLRLSAAGLAAVGAGRLERAA